MLDPQQVYLESADPKTERVAHIYEIYRQELAKSNALDFDDLLLYAVRVLKSSGEVRERYNRRYPLHPGRRVPGHEPPAVRADAHAGRQRAQRLRRRRRGPEHLLVARRRHPQHPGVRAGLSRGAHHPPGAELPLDAEHPAGRVGGGCAQRQAQGQEPVDRPQRRRADRLLRSARRRERGAVRRRLHRQVPAAGPDARMARRRARPCSIAPTRNRGWWKRRCAATR